MRLRTLILFFCLSSAVAAAETHTFYIGLNAKERLKRQDWSGRAEISNGRIVSVQKDSGPMDKVHPDMSWTIIYGRGLRPGAKQPTRPKGIFITVEGPPDAVVTVKTKGGDFSFKVGEVTPKGIQRLDGNIVIWKDRPRGEYARRKRKGRRKPVPPPAIAGELPAQPVTDRTRQSEWPAVTVTSDGATWAAFVEWNGKAGDRVIVKRRARGEDWSAPIVLDDGCWDHYWPALAARGDGVMAFWSAQKDGNFELYCCEITAGGGASAVRQLTRAPHAEFQARAASDRAGNVTLVWQSLRNGQSDVYARRFSNGEWGEEVRVSPSEAGDWQPSVALDGSGSAWIAWDGYDAGNYDVYLRRFDAGGLGPVIRITTEPIAQFHSTVAVDGRDRVWVAWDDGGENWGKDLSTSSAAPGNRGLHASRRLGIRVYCNGAVWNPKPDLYKALTGGMTQYAELPQLAVDSAGTLWLVFRYWTIRHPTEMYHIYVTRLNDDGWAMPWKFAESSGRNTQWADMAVGADGRVLVVYASDGRAPDNLPKDQVHALIYGVFISALERGGGLADVELAKAELPPPARDFRRRPRTTFAAGPLAEWNWPNARFDCLLEIYQGCRGSYEAWNLPTGEKRGGTQTRKPGHFAQDALARGNRYGFVSFSDHRSTHNSYAAVWVEDVSREGILEGLYARRTFAASDEIVLKVTAGEHAVGEEFTADADSPVNLVIEAKAPDTILRVDVVKDGKYIWTRNPKSREFRAEFRDTDVKKGECYYYVRLFQRDPEAPEGDPEMAWSSPFFVKYE